MLKCLAATILLCSFAPATMAGVTSRTNYHYFTVSGGSAASIYRSMRRGSSPVDARSTIANTDYSVTTNTVKSKGLKCRVTAVNTTIVYDIHLPRLSDGGDLSPGLRSDWRSFVAYLRGHEDRHRALWAGCVARFNSSVQSVVGSDCNSADAKVDARWAAAERSCRSQNDSYNDYAARAVRQQPFMRRVMNGG